MSDVKWCDFGQHPFTTARSGSVHTQASMKGKAGRAVVADIDICPDCVPSSPYASMAEDDETDNLERRIRAVESAQAQKDREELAVLRQREADRQRDNYTARHASPPNVLNTAETATGLGIRRAPHETD